MRVLITGAAGFIGSYMVEHHLKKGDHVYAIDDLSSGSETNLNSLTEHPNFQFSNADIVTWQEIEKMVLWSDRIYHMAAIVGVYKVLQDPARVLAVNIAGCERLLRAVKTTNWKPRVIIFSSSEVYGPSLERQLSEDNDLTIESAAKNRWHYAVSKLADESFALAYYRKFGVPITMVRLFNTIGPRQIGRYGMVVPRFVEQAIKNEPITVFGSGNQTRSFCDVRDTVVMLDMLASCDKSIGEIVNVGNDHEITINELAQLVKKIAKSDSKIEHIPYDEAYGEEYVDILFRRPDLKKLLSLIDYRFKWPLDKSISDIMEYKKNAVYIRSE